MSNMRAGMSNDGGNSGIGYVEIDPSGRYGRLEEVLGKGAVKTVHRAFDEVLGMEVAWSQVFLNDVLRSPEELQRLYTEVHLLKKLNHDALIKFYTSWIDSDRRTFNVITEMFSSGSLRQYRQKYKQVSIWAIKNWARQILRGLVYLHGQNPPVIHRDLKCDNIFVNGHLGQVKIGDLGLAAILQGSPHAHSVIGTPEFMAPELYEEEYNELVDVYSFGMCVLEMLTSEFPYCECSNPAQIYKKVSTGKKPNAFYRIKDVEAQRFVAKCLETASKRLPAHQLLLDPFLSTGVDPLPRSGPLMQTYCSLKGKPHAPLLLDVSRRSTDMTITGKMNPVDKTIFLKVQIAGQDGDIRNVHFPFDILNDTPMDVAKEMVRELDIAGREPVEIAKMIEEEISLLVPEWNDEYRSSTVGFHQQQSFRCGYHDNADEHHLLYDELRPRSPTHQSLPDRFHGDLLTNEDTSSESSCGYNFSDSSYSLADDNACNSRRAEIPADIKNHLWCDDNACNSRPDSPTGVEIHGCTRFCPQENSKSPNKCDGLTDHLKHRGPYRRNKLSKIRSFMDVRTQLLHKALTQALHKGRLLRTVGAVEDIGFQRSGCKFSEKSNLRRNNPTG